MSTNEVLAPVAQNSRYRFKELSGPGGRRRALRIEGEGRNTVFVIPKPTCLLMRYRDERREWHTRSYGFFDYYPLSDDVASGLIVGWEPPEGKPGWPGVRAWVHKRTARAIGKRLHSYYKRSLDDVDPTVLALQRAVFAATFSAPGLVLGNKLYREKYVVKDVTRHRAAAVALAGLGTFSGLRRERAWRDARATVLRSTERAALEELAKSTGVRLSVHATPERRFRAASLPVDEALGVMEGWRGLFSPTGEPYRSLDRTLMNLPGGVPAGLMPYLSLVRLERPVLARSELAVLALHERRRFGADGSAGKERVFRHASANRIARATRLVAEHTRNPLTARRTGDLRFVVDFLMDCPDEHGGNIVGLAEKSIQWHRRQQEEEVERTLKRLGRDRATEAPPVPLPGDPNVAFLADVRGVCEEGLRMKNCVASYAGRAAKGYCYLFHVSHAGEEATVEVDRAGRVVQAAGPGNEINAASRWGRRVLNRWGKGFPEGHESTARPPDFEEDDLENIPF